MGNHVLIVSGGPVGYRQPIATNDSHQNIDMRPSRDKRNKNRTLHSRAFGVLVVLWVSLGFQPCAVAAVNDPGCPHCPPGHEQPTATHGGHSDGMAETSSCAGMQSMICEADEAVIDSRIGKIDDNDAGVVVAALATTAAINPVASDAFVAIASDPPERRRSAIPLYILYCVYRD